MSVLAKIILASPWKIIKGQIFKHLTSSSSTSSSAMKHIERTLKELWTAQNSFSFYSHINKTHGHLSDGHRTRNSHYLLLHCASSIWSRKLIVVSQWILSAHQFSPNSESVRHIWLSYIWHFTWNYPIRRLLKSSQLWEKLLAHLSMEEHAEHPSTQSLWLELPRSTFRWIN